MEKIRGMTVRKATDLCDGCGKQLLECRCPDLAPPGADAAYERLREREWFE